MEKTDKETNNYNLGPVKIWIYPWEHRKEGFLEEVTHAMTLKG